MMKRAVLLAFVVCSNALLHAQTAGGAARGQAAAPAPEITRLTGGVTLSMGENMEIAADEAEYNQTTGEIALFGTVVLRQLHRRLTQVIPATNPGGVALPEPKEVVVRIRGNFQIAIGELTIEANEADVNTQTGETELRGNVKLTRPKK